MSVPGAALGLGTGYSILICPFQCLLLAGELSEAVSVQDREMLSGRAENSGPLCLHKADHPAEPAHGQGGNLQVVQLGRK